ncbi:MAG: DAK2 domain-containing protein [Clostridia bacterium]|nr:DAK2 domain-containing protein [Clostridia bacterium]
MATRVLDGKLLRNMLIGAAEHIKNNKEELNDLNVFPVPDGDTGTNMTKTIEGGLLQVAELESDSVSSVMDKFAHGLLLSARGNSGVILSQIFAGIREALEKFEKVSASELCEAYKSGVKKSYSAVSNPTEGTILTVFRESTEYAEKRIDGQTSIEDFFKMHIDEARRSLERTKEILPVLAEAGVVDSGGAGYLCIAVGMYSALTGEYNAATYRFSEQSAPAALDFDRFTRDSEMKYGYCTEFLLRLTTKKCDPDAYSAESLAEELKSLGGESIVAYKEKDIIKIHVHIMEPGIALNCAQKYGEFLTLKIENMALGHSDTERVKEKKEKKEKKRGKLATVAVASGEGICALFTDMGADEIVSGGQTANPSAEEFIEAFDRAYADDIIVLPNNKNVMLAAKQAADMYEGARVHIVPTATLMEGYGALSVITPGVTNIEKLVESATRAAKSILGGEITRAVRDVTIGGKDIERGNYIAIVNGEIVATDADREATLFGMLDAVDMDDYEIINLFAGADVSDDARVKITDELSEKYPDHEVVVYLGKQELYDFYIALE